MKDKQSSLLSEAERRFLTPDLLSEEELETEAEMPVPDRLLPKSKCQFLVRRLKLSQKIGILLWLNREGLLSPGGKSRLLYLQEKAPFGAISAGLKFCDRLQREKKLQSDFKHEARELNRRPQSKKFRRREARRIGVGYRDKGTLPVVSNSARRKAVQEAYIPAIALKEEFILFLGINCPEAFVEAEEFVDLTVVSQVPPERFQEIHELLSSL